MPLAKASATSLAFLDFFFDDEDDDAVFAPPTLAVLPLAEETAGFDDDDDDDDRRDAGFDAGPDAGFDDVEADDDDVGDGDGDGDGDDGRSAPESVFFLSPSRGVFIATAPWIVIVARRALKNLRPAGGSGGPHATAWVQAAVGVV